MEYLVDICLFFAWVVLPLVMVVGLVNPALLRDRKTGKTLTRKELLGGFLTGIVLLSAFGLFFKMEWYLWVAAVIAALFALGVVLGEPTKQPRRKSTRAEPASFEDQTRRIIQESLLMAATTKRRITAENRLGDVHRMLDELHGLGATNTDDMESRSKANHLEAGLDERFLKKTSTAKPRGISTKTAFMQRWKSGKEGAEIHPYAQWVAVMDYRTAQACSDLHGKAWRVDGENFADLVHTHFVQKHKDCRCRMRSMTMRAINDEQVQRMD